MWRVTAKYAYINEKQYAKVAELRSALARAGYNISFICDQRLNLSIIMKCMEILQQYIGKPCIVLKVFLASYSGQKYVLLFGSFRKFLQISLCCTLVSQHDTLLKKFKVLHVYGIWLARNVITLLMVAFKRLRFFRPLSGLYIVLCKVFSSLNVTAKTDCGR